MESRGRLVSVTRDIRSDDYIVSVKIPDLPTDLENKDLDIRIIPHRAHRSKDANAMLWSCIGDIAKALRTDKWEVYLILLKRYGKFETIYTKVEAVESIRLVWREVEVVDTNTDDAGNVMATVNCYIGSSSYNAQEMSALIDGTISEMKEIGIQPPPSREMHRALERLGNG